MRTHKLADFLWEAQLPEVFFSNRIVGFASDTDTFMHHVFGLVVWEELANIM
jgi:hypothetical protein